MPRWGQIGRSKMDHLIRCIHLLAFFDNFARTVLENQVSKSSSKVRISSRTLLSPLQNSGHWASTIGLEKVGGEVSGISQFLLILP